jgi:hypothetical protein
MNKLIVPKSLLEVQEWKRKAGEVIRKHGLAEAERRGARWLHKSNARKIKTSVKH